jgi:predicted tellurium resistance membrane protein TerC
MPSYFYFVGCLVFGIVFAIPLLAKNINKSFKIVVLAIGDIGFIGFEIYQHGMISIGFSI